MTTGENLGHGVEDVVSLGDIAEVDETDLRDFVADVSEEGDTTETPDVSLVVQEAAGAVATGPQVVMPPRHVMTGAVSIPLRRITHFNLDGSTTSSFAPIDFPSDGAF